MLDPQWVSVIDQIVILPVLDSRANKTVDVDLEDMRKNAQKFLERKHYAVIQADSPPPGARWVMRISLQGLGGRPPGALVYGSMRDEQSGALLWQWLAGGGQQSAPIPNQPTQGVLTQAANQSVAQLADITMLLLMPGSARKDALNNAVFNLLTDIPEQPGKKKK